MSKTPPFLNEWMGQTFWEQGAFITTSEGRVILGKGGRIEESEGILETYPEAFYLKDFYQKKFLCYTPDSTITLPFKVLFDWAMEISTSRVNFNSLHNDDDLYERDFRQLKKSFGQFLEKVVLLSRESYGGFSGVESIKHFFKKAIQFNIGAPYGFWDKEKGVLGCTPEILFKLEGNQLSTLALAGTGRAGEEEKLLHSPKDLHEHELVVKDISEKLSPFSHEISLFPTHILSFKTLIHLKTEISATLIEKTSLTTLINSLSPTAALGGHPQRASLDFLQQTHYYQKYPERFFGSCFGVATKEVREFLVTIRSVQWNKGVAFIESGGGVVVESEFFKELEEIKLKRNLIKSHYFNDETHSK